MGVYSRGVLSVFLVEDCSLMRVTCLPSYDADKVKEVMPFLDAAWANFDDAGMCRALVKVGSSVLFTG